MKSTRLSIDNEFRLILAKLELLRRKQLDAEMQEHVKELCNDIANHYNEALHLRDAIETQDEIKTLYKSLVATRQFVDAIDTASNKNATKKDVEVLNERTKVLAATANEVKRTMGKTNWYPLVATLFLVVGIGLTIAGILTTKFAIGLGLLGGAYVALKAAQIFNKAEPNYTNKEAFANSVGSMASNISYYSGIFAKKVNGRVKANNDTQPTPFKKMGYVG